MKVWCLCIVGMIVGCSTIYAQTSLLEKRITLICNDKPIAKILEEIRQTYQIPFSYFNVDSGLQQQISIDIRNKPLKEVLEVLFKTRNIHYQAIGGQIVLKMVGSAKPNTSKALQLSATALSGNSTDAEVINNEIQFVSHVHDSSTGIDKNKPKTRSKSIVNTKAILSKDKIVSSQKNTSVKRTTELNNAHKQQKSPEEIQHFRNIFSLVALPSRSAYLLPVPANLEAQVLHQSIKFLLPLEHKVYTTSKFYIGLLPGIGTHGIHPGAYVNNISLNMLAGYSAGNRFVEIGGLSNFNQHHVLGLQISGIANVVGGNKFVGLTKQEKQKVQKENTEANIQGVQLAGLTNIIAGNVYGWQTAGGINIVEQSLQGVQVAGISNLVKTFTFGIQLAGISNASMESVDGLQVAGLYNYTKGELHGIQVSAFNQASNIEGKHSKISVPYTGLQIGLLNTSKRMNGYQIGLVNVAGEMAGTQIGLLNFNTNKKISGTPIGLLNFNSKGQFIRLYTSELFLSNAELSTGSVKIQNMLSFGYNPSRLAHTNRPRWYVGYSVGQVKRPSDKFFYSYDAGIAYLNPSGKITRELSLLSKVRGTAGYKIYLRKVIFHVFGGITFNSYFTKGDKLPVSPDFLRLYHQSNHQTNIEVWPGFVAGIHI